MTGLLAEEIPHRSHLPSGGRSWVDSNTHIHYRRTWRPRRRKRNQSWFGLIGAAETPGR